MNNELNRLQIEKRLFNLVVFRSLRGELKINEINEDVSNQPVFTAAFKNQKCLANLKEDYFFVAVKSDISPLHYLAKHYDGFNDINELIMFINLMVSCGFQLDELDTLGNSPLHYACSNEYSIQLVYSLLKCGAKLINTNLKKETPLHIAIKNDKWYTCKLLVSWIPQCLYDPTIVKYCLDVIESGKSSHLNSFIHLRALSKFVIWLQNDNCLQYINIFLQLELTHPYSVILGKLNGNLLVNYSYSFGQYIANMFNVPLPNLEQNKLIPPPK